MKNATGILELITALVSSFEPDLKDLTLSELTKKSDLVNRITDESLVTDDISVISNCLFNYVYDNPAFNPRDLTKCFRLDTKYEEQDNTGLLTVAGKKFLDNERESFIAYSFIMILSNGSLTSVKFEFSDFNNRRATNKQRLFFRTIVDIKQELSLEFFNVPKKHTSDLQNLLRGLSQVDGFIFKDQFIFTLGGVISHNENLIK